VFDYFFNPLNQAQDSSVFSVTKATNDARSVQLNQPLMRADSSQIWASTFTLIHADRVGELTVNRHWGPLARQSRTTDRELRVQPRFGGFRVCVVVLLALNYGELLLRAWWIGSWARLSRSYRGKVGPCWPPSQGNSVLVPPRSGCTPS
jgi:hypothetical protein